MVRAITKAAMLGFLASTGFSRAEATSKAPSETPTYVAIDAWPTETPTSFVSDAWPTEPPTLIIIDNWPTETPTFVVDEAGFWQDCPDDIRLKHTHGSTAFSTSSTSAVWILSQDTDTVTVELNQVWDATVDKYFYSFKESMYSNQCYEEEGFAPGETLQPITLQCLASTPVASLEICLQDIEGGLLSDADDATVSKCCHSDAPEGTPTVCYSLEIMCETTCVTEESRMLRGRI